MRKLLLSIIILILFNQLLFSASYHITTTASLTYSPDLLSAKVGDVITIDASTIHPLVQVSSDSWQAKDATPLPGGWGTKTSPYTFTIANTDTIYFVCANHVGLGMRGRIAVQSVSDVNELSADLSYINISPNPLNSEGIFTIYTNMQPNFTIKIYDDFGNIAKTLSAANLANVGENQFLFDVSGLGNGAYLLVLSDNYQQYMKKFIILK